MKRNRKAEQLPAIPTNLGDEFVADILSLDLSGFKYEYLSQQLLTKYVGEGTASATERSERAISKWLARERLNAKTNERLLLDSTVFRFRDGTTVKSINSDRILGLAADFIANAIGEVSDLSGGFSSGATTSKGRKYSSTDEKFASQGDITPDCEPVWAWMCFQHPMLARLATGEGTISKRSASGNILFCVPKNSEIDRVACMEPDLNMYCQKAIGNHFRESLRRQGIDLNDQTRNQRLAKIGVRDSLATIDLSSASDSVTTQLCCRLLSPDWFYLLMATRSPSTTVGDEEIELQMISSMGNGFTFELESLIFWALARSVAYLTGTPGAISVYGDDIIVPCRMVTTLIAVLGFCGFSVNKTKSFWTGPFRESCGSHWYNGTCVKPFFIRRKVSTLSDLILHLNAIRRWGSDKDGVLVDPRLLPLWRKYAAFVPKALWGGYDCSSADALVSAPQKGTPKRLQAIVKHLPRNELGSYVRWWHTSEVECSSSIFYERLTTVGQRIVKDFDSVRKVHPRPVFWAETDGFV